MFPDSLIGIADGMAVLDKSRLAQQRQRGKAWFQGTILFKQATQVIEWLSRNPLVVLAGIAFFVVVYILFWHLPVGQLENLRAQHVVELYRVKAAIRGTFAQSLGVVLLIVGLYFAWRRVLAVEEGQITERFTRAIEQLGHEKLEIRLGGIYALERIARDSEKDHWPIMEVLTAYVRENAPRQGGEEEASRPVKPPPTDIQAILTVIVRREKAYEKGENEPLNLRDTQLAGANLHYANLSGAKLEGADLPLAKLHGADLHGAILVNTNLFRADLRGADLSGAYLQDANLRMANSHSTKLRNANLSRANLVNTNLSGADLRGADLTDAKNLTCEQVQSAITDDNTKLPDYLTEQDAAPAKQ